MKERVRPQVLDAQGVEDVPGQTVKGKATLVEVDRTGKRRKLGTLQSFHVHVQEETGVVMGIEKRPLPALEGPKPEPIAIFVPGLAALKESLDAGGQKLLEIGDKRGNHLRAHALGLLTRIIEGLERHGEIVLKDVRRDEEPTDAG